MNTRVTLRVAGGAALVPTTPYDDGRFVGQQQVWLDCEGSPRRRR
jgi:hypothetical protein